MLNQKDNDFDDLFRRASDKYPLRTDSADWDRMAAALDDPTSALPEMQDTDRRRKRRFLWFFLLLPVGGVGYYIFHQVGIDHGHAVATESVAKAPAGGAGANSGNGAGENSGNGTDANGNGTEADGAGTGANGAGTGADGSGAGGAKAGANDAGTGESAVKTGAGGSVASGAGKGSRAVDANGPGSGGAGTVAAGAGSGDAGSGDARSGNARLGNAGAGSADGGATVMPGVLKNRRGRSGAEGIKETASGGVVGGAGSGELGVSKDGEVGGASNGMVGGGRTAGNGKSIEASRVANYPVNRAPISKNYDLTVNVVAPVVTKDSSKVKPKASSKRKSSFLYAGLLAAPDLSTVKFQSTNGVGTTFSLLLGYQFNKRWAVETGVSLDRKKYYTSAEYFKLKPYVQPNQDLESLNGTCYMWEIPINVRYNFSQSEKNKWFATAGLSTYLMTSENYNYNYTWWGPTGNTGTGSKPWEIKKPSQYWFSIINLSAGYEHRLGAIGNLRIEPYLRVPLSGLGTGKLNILSTGINIGITRRLW